MAENNVFLLLITVVINSYHQSLRYVISLMSDWFKPRSQAARVIGSQPAWQLRNNKKEQEMTAH